MSNALHPAIRNVAAELTATEASTDAQLEASAALIVSIIRERTAAGLPFGSTQGALNDAGEAINLQLKSRYHIARAHEQLRRAAVKHKLVPKNYGDVFPWCDGEGATLTEPAPVPLRVVGS